MADALPVWLAHIPLDGLLRIDLGQEGDWSGSVTTVWRPDTGFLGWGGREWRHPRFRPALELYFVDGWIGIRCDRRVDDGYALDQPRVMAVIRFVETEGGAA